MQNGGHTLRFSSGTATKNFHIATALLFSWSGAHTSRAAPGSIAAAGTATRIAAASRAAATTRTILPVALPFATVASAAAALFVAAVDCVAEVAAPQSKAAKTAAGGYRAAEEDTLQQFPLTASF